RASSPVTSSGDATVPRVCNGRGGAPASPRRTRPISTSMNRSNVSSNRPMSAGWDTSVARAAARTSPSREISISATAARNARVRPASTGSCARRSSRGRTSRFRAVRSARTRGFGNELGQLVRADASDVFLVLEQNAERFAQRRLVHLACAKRHQGHRPVERLRDAGPLEEIVAAKRLYDGNDGPREPLRYVRKAAGQDGELAIGGRI